MKYTAIFGIDGGIYNGDDLRFLDYCEKEEIFELEEKEANDSNAFGRAAIIGYGLSRDYLPNSNINHLVVTLLSLKNRNGFLNQEEFLSEYGGLKLKNGSLEIPRKNGKMIFSGNMLEHLLKLL